MKLYDLEPSGNCYKVRLFAALAQIPLQIVPVDFMAGEHKQAKFLAMNPWGELPVLVDDNVVLRDSQAILVYLASKYGGEAWLPKQPAHMAEVVQWLSTASNEVQNGPAAARLVDKFGYAIDKADTIKRSARILPLLEARLSAHAWLAMGRPTIADCAVFPYVALAPEGGVSLAPYPAIQAWIARVKALPNFIGMSGVSA
jgi:glutathione S-transferase